MIYQDTRYRLYSTRYIVSSMLQVSVAVVTWEFLKMSLTRPEPYIAYSLVYSILHV